jgi:hypothetical protein
MTSLTIDLPDELAHRLSTVPKETVNRFAIAALRRFPDSEYQGISETIAPIANLLYLRDGWNGTGFLAPTPASVARAIQWTIALYDEAKGETWIAPHATASANGEAVLEWWNGQKKLTLYFSEEGVEYIKSWGVDIFAEMEDGNADTSEARSLLWKWLVGQ